MKAVSLTVTTLCATGMVAGILYTHSARGQQAPASSQDHSDWYQRVEVNRVDRGLAIAPVPLNYEHKDKYLVGLGSYLVNSVASCAECHTNPPYAPGGNPYLGQKKKINTVNYLAGGQAFGPFLSRNLTPEKNGLPAGLTYNQFVTVMRTGIDLDHAHPQFGPYLQVMPWPVFQTLTDNDLRAIYTYLKAVPPAKPGK